MLIRALIVVLAIFNAGVALWWWSQPPVTDAPVPVMSPPEGVALLQLRSEVPVLAADAAAQDNALALSVAASAADNAAPAGSDTGAGALAGSAQVRPRSPLRPRRRYVSAWGRLPIVPSWMLRNSVPPGFSRWRGRVSRPPAAAAVTG